MQLQARRYNVRSAINLTHTTGAHGADVCLEGTVRSTQYQRGSLLVGNTGEGKCVIETSDVDGVHLRNVGIVAGTERPSSIGLLQGRGTERDWAGDQFHENLYIDMGSDPTANNGLGRVGIVNLAGEETRYHNLQVWANLPLVLTWSNGCQRTRGDLSGQDSYRFASSVGVEFVETASNTVFALTGLGRLIAYDYVSPCVLINAAGTVDLGHTFMQLRRSDAPGVTIGQYRYAVENWNAYQFRHFGAVEGAGGYLMNRRSLTEAEINVRLAGTGEMSLPALYLFDDGGDYAITNSDVTLMSYDVERPLVLSRRLDGNVRAPMRFAINNCRFRCNMPLSPTAFPDGRVLAQARHTDWSFGDRSLTVGEGSLSSEFGERLGAGAGPTELLRLQLPGPPGENEPFVGVLMVEAVLVDAVVGAHAEPIAETISADFRVLRGGEGRVSASLLAGPGDAPTGGYSLDCVPDQDGGAVHVRLLREGPEGAERENCS